MFDLAKALAKKGEVESARLDAFWFRHRARTMRLAAERVLHHAAAPFDPAEIARAVARADDEAIFADLRARLAAPMPDEAWAALLAAAASQARAELIAEHGDPFPHRLA